MKDAEKITALEIHNTVLKNFVDETVEALMPLHDLKWENKLKLIPGDKLNVKGIKSLIAYTEKLEQELGLVTKTK